jgi:repressor LexA
MSTENRPTKKQRELLTFIDNFISGHGYGPSYREIMRGMGYRSVATVAVHIDNLITKGLLKKKDNSARSLEVVGSSKEFVTNKVNKSDEKWLIAIIEQRFSLAESHGKPSQTDVDELYVLVGSLKVLGFEGASNSFTPRLANLKKKL